MTIKIKWPGFNVLFAVGLILFFIAFALMWAYVLMPICEARDWKPPCPPHPHESVGPGG